MPLVHAGGGTEEPVTDAHERARKIRTRYAKGELIRVAGGRNLAEAELIQNLLLEEGIPSMLRRTRGFDVPDFLAAGPRDVLVPESAYEAARDLLTQSGMQAEVPEPGSMPGIGSPGRLLAGILIAVALAAALVWLLYQLAT